MNAFAWSSKVNNKDMLVDAEYSYLWGWRKTGRAKKGWKGSVSFQSVSQVTVFLLWKSNIYTIMCDFFLF